MNELLAVQGMVAGYEGGLNLQRVTFSLSPGQWILVSGDNGSGKTTLLKALAGTLTVRAGCIRFGANNISRASLEHRVMLGIGYLRQTHNVFLDLRANEFLRIAHRGSNASYLRRLDWLSLYFPQVHGLLDFYGGVLSGGQRQVLAICAILMNPKRLLLLDEPTSGLSDPATKSIRDAIANLVAQENLAVIMIDHDPASLGKVVDQIFTMDGGALKVEATTRTQSTHSAETRGV